jgi:hypothetical protein
LERLSRFRREQRLTLRLSRSRGGSSDFSHLPVFLNWSSNFSKSMSVCSTSCPFPS